MTPREFLGFFRTRTGKLVVFGLVFGGGMMLLSALRQDENNSMKARFGMSASKETDKPQVVQSVERDMETCRPPQPKPEAAARPPRVSEPAKIFSPAPKPEPPPTPPAPISLFADSSAGITEPKTLGAVYAPFGRL